MHEITKDDDNNNAAYSNYNHEYEVTTNNHLK